LHANRFLVGDVKQSIYRFRLADPRIFQHYEKSWPQCLPLAENFRSREALLHFINSLFRTVMRPVLGGLHYDANAELQFGNAAGRAALALASETTARTELHVITKDFDREAEEANGDIADLQTTEREARLIAHRFAELKKSGYQVWSKTEKKFLPVEFRDMVVLLRGVSGRAEIFAKEFHRAGVPLHAARAGFLDALEVTDLLNLLKLLDNPLQDVPLLAVLRSPLVGLTPDELAEIRISGGRDLFWTALQNSKLKTQNLKLAATLQTFLAQFAAWRELARHSSVTHCLETALAATHYEALLLADERGAARVANIRRFVELARRFDPYQREGLFRFLQFIAAQTDAEVRHEPAAVAAVNTVRLMTIHSSKGLEFPIVAVAGLGAPFNLLDLRADILLDEEFGLCPRVQPPGARSRYPSIAHWAATQRERRALLGEEMRLLYVALTRARDHLVLVGSATRADEAARWQEASPLNDHALLKANNFLAWLRLWFTQQDRDDAWRDDYSGEQDFVRWEFHDALAEVFSATTPTKNDSASEPELTAPTPEQLATIEAALAWRYAHAAARSEPAKTSVSVLRRRLITDDVLRIGSQFTPTAKTPGQLSAVESGTTHHKFLQLLALDRADTELDLRNQANGFLEAGILSAEDFAALDFAALADFWQSEFGQRVRRAPAQNVHRELPFTARMTTKDLRELDLLPANSELPEDEFVTVQGAVDLAVIFPGKEIWLVDFKTDAVDEAGLDARTEKYRQQLLLYARALARIYRAPVRDCHLHFLKLRRLVAVEI
ncbi:MAG: helicase-exonuclease AddAB subunit AddA, partial [Verrucomicrobiota bacterium]